MTMTIIDGTHTTELNGKHMANPIAGCITPVYILQGQWWNTDSFWTLSAWTEAKMAAAAAACAGYSIVVWDFDSENGFWTDKVHIPDNTTRAARRDFIYGIADELRSRLAPGTLLGYYAGLPVGHSLYQTYADDTDANFNASSSVTSMKAANDDYVAYDFDDHFDMLLPFWYPPAVAYDAGRDACRYRRMAWENDRIATATDLPAYPYLLPNLYAPSAYMTGEQMYGYLSAVEDSGVDTAILYGYYASGTERYQALRDFLRKTRQTVKMETFCLIGDSQTSANKLSYNLLTALHGADRATHWREEPAAIIGSSWTMADAAAGIDAALAAVTGYVDYVLINLGGYDLASLPDEASYEASLTYVLEAVHAKWGVAKIYIAYPWQPSYDANAVTVSGWHDTVIDYREIRTFDTFAGIDIQTAIEGHTSGVNPDATGTTALAAAWAALLTA